MREATSLGVHYAEVRFEDTIYESLTYVNGRILGIGHTRMRGAGIRVVINGSVGFASTTILSKEELVKALKEAISIAKAIGKGRIKFSKEEPSKGSFSLENVKEHPGNVEWDYKIDLTKRVYEAARGDKAVSTTSRYAAYYGLIEFYNIEGYSTCFKPLLIGLGTFTVTKINGKTGDGAETVGASKGLELFKSKTPEEIGSKAYKKALEKAKAKYTSPGQQTVIIAPRLAGVFAHESFGHLSEADNIVSGVSPLTGKVGEKIASDAVTIIDEGIVTNGGYFIPVDDEGVITRKVVLVDKGILKGYLHSRESAALLGAQSTGNARSQDFRYEPIIRMRNTYFDKGEWNKEEIISETKRGLFLDDPRGGQVNLDGTFTFTASRGYIIENGEIKEPVRDVVLAGNILEMLKYVDAASKDVEIFTSPFGGCGKWGQRAFVGLGGPTLRVTRLMVGGRRE